LLAALLVALLWFRPAAASEACNPDGDCRIAEGEFVLRLPKGWDGRRPLPLLVFFHGFGDTPADVLARSDIGSLADAQDLILALPAGLDRRWHVRPGGPRPRDDLAFASAVVEAVMARHPVDPGLVVASGFSAGAFVTWYLACYRPGRFTGFLPVAGAFWQPVPEGPCPGGPVAIRHVHGLSDATVPLAGRQVSAGARQGDIRASLATALGTARCGPVPVTTVEDGQSCTTWRGCAPPGRLTFCAHHGGHVVAARWLAEGLSWLRSRGPDGH
jgi:polyhydroxybutyrate depolymerase